MSLKISTLFQKALEIDENYAPTHAGLGRNKVFEYDWKGAETDIKRALALNPGDGDTHLIYSLYLAVVGRMNEAIIEIKLALELDPLSSYYRFVFSWFQCCSGQFDQAMKISQETFELDPNNTFASYGLAMAYGGKGMYDKGISLLQKFGNVPSYAAALGYLYGKAGKKEEAQKILNDFLARSKKEYFSPYFIAIVYSGLGDNLGNHEEAVSALKRTLSMTPSNIFAISVLKATYVEMGRMEEALALDQEVAKTMPTPRPPPEFFREISPWKDPKVTERYVEADRKLRAYRSSQQ